MPLLVALTRRPGGAPVPALRAFTLGLVTGAVSFTGTLYWMTTVMRVYGGLHPLAAVPVHALLVAYLALYPALFAVITVRLLRRFGLAALLLAPAVWVAAEYGRGTLLGGFPWVLLGSSQASLLPIAQAASLVGVYGLSLVIAFVNTAAAYVLVGGARRGPQVAAGVAAVGLVAALAAWGQARIGDAGLTRAGVPIRVGIVQGNVPQDQKWAPDRAATILQRYLEGTRDAAAAGASLVVWPESATPFFFEEDAAGREAIVRTVRTAGVHLLFGSDQIEGAFPLRYYNAAFMLTPDGRTAAVYRKMHLVPFGEYVPFKRLLFFVGPLIEAVSDFSAGTEPTLLPVGDRRISTAICYESVFPSLIGRFTRSGSELLTTITNDAWYGRSSAPYQHFAQGSMRAIEQGRYLVRAANTGISAIVDPYGRVTDRTGLFETRVLVGTARFLTTRTVYATIGDLAAQLSVFLTALALVASRGRRRAAA